jgi:hypothetical protein
MSDAAHYIVLAYTDGTLRTYGGGLRLYERAAADLAIFSGRPLWEASHPGGWFPPVHDDLRLFTTHAFKNLHKSCGAIENALAALRARCAMEGASTLPFSDGRLLLALKGIRRADISRARPLRIPITAQILGRIFATVPLALFNDQVIFGAMVAGLYGLLRASEFVSKPPYGCTLRRKHFERPSADLVRLFLVRSKTDTFAEGVWIEYVATGGGLCPVKWLGWIFDNAPNQDPESAFFQTADGQPLAYAYFQAALKAFCFAIGISKENVSCHSLRIGGATTLFALGFSADVVKKMGRWISDCYQRYQRMELAVRRKIFQALASAAASGAEGDYFGGLALDQVVTINATNLDDFSSKLDSAGRKPKKVAAKAKKAASRPNSWSQRSTLRAAWT